MAVYFLAAIVGSYAQEYPQSYDTDIRMIILTEEEVRQLLTQKEGQFHDFKSLWDRSGTEPKSLDRRKVRDFIAKYTAAFANADGGILVLGVEDDGTPSGHQYPSHVIEEFLKVPAQRLRPAVQTRHQQIEIEGCKILLIDIPITSEAIMVEGNGFPYRIGDSVVQEPQEVVNARKQAYRRTGFEQRIDPDARIDHLDLALAQTFFQHSILRSRDILEQLKYYGLIIEKPGGFAVTNGALLLFGKPPFVQWHPRAGVRFFRVEGTTRKPGKERNVSQLFRLEPPLARMIEDAYAVARGQIRTSEKLHSLFFREVPEYPTFAWQEALVNAIAHRDCNEQGREIEVTFFEDRMEILSPGDLIAPVTLEALLEGRSVHASRNPVIVRVLVETGIMREEGEGIPRMHEEMRESLLHPPQFAVDNAAFLVTLLNEPRFEGAALEWKIVVEGLDLAINQKRALLAFAEGFSNEDYRRLNNIDRDQAYREINDLVSKHILTSTGSSGRGVSYHIAPILDGRRRWLGERLHKLQVFFQQNERLKNAEYQNLFNVDRATALRELQLLVSEKVLEREGSRRWTVYTFRQHLNNLV